MKLKWIALLSFVGISSSWGAAESFTFEEGVLTITTPRYEVRWKQGNLVGFKTFLPVERLLAEESEAHEGVLPGGPSLRHDDEQKPQQYHPFFSVARDQAAFNLGLKPRRSAVPRYERTEKGARLIFDQLGRNRNGSWIQEFEIDPATGDLRLIQKATLESGGLSGISFGITGLKAAVPLAVPAFPGNGQVWHRDARVGEVINIGYPRFWAAGLIIGMIPEGGSFAVWSEDDAFRPKYFRNYSDGTQRSIGFEAALDYPYHENREITVATWRINTFAGNWTEPAGRYRDQMQAAHHLQPLHERSPAWLKDVSMIWSTGGGTAAELEAMAEMIDPAKVVLWDFTGSTIESGLNMRVPEYIPAEAFIERNARAREEGFHVASYYSMALIDVKAHPEMMRDLEVGFYFDALGSTVRSEAGSDRLIYIHPGSAKWREFYAAKMKEVFESYHVDMLYQDVAGTAVGSAGVADGKNFNQAIIAADAAIHQAVPQAGLGGEYWNEVTIVHESIGLQRSLSWGGPATREYISRMETPHPISSFLFSPFSYYYGYKVPQRDPHLWHLDQNMNEVIGALPDWRTNVNDTSPEAKATLLRAGLWAEGFRPWFPAEWQEGVVSYMKKSDSQEQILYRRDERGSFCFRRGEEGEQLIYGRVTGVRQLRNAGEINLPGWIAYDEGAPIGLNPDRYYVIFPGKPEPSELQITRLPEEASLNAFRRSDDYLLATFNQPIDAAFAWELKSADWKVAKGNIGGQGALLAYRQQPAATAIDAELPVQDLSLITTLNGLPVDTISKAIYRNIRLDGKERQGVEILPPPGGKDSEMGVEQLITLPAEKDVALEFAIGRRGGAGDGVHIIARVNGHEIWREFSPSEAGVSRQVIPLGQYAGQTVVVGVHVDAGPSGYNRSNDECRVGLFRLIRHDQAPAPKSGKAERQSETPIEDETYR